MIKINEINDLSELKKLKKKNFFCTMHAIDLLFADTFSVFTYALEFLVRIHIILYAHVLH